MRNLLRLGLLGLIVATVIGCPRPVNRAFDFTSADLQGSRGFLDYLGGLAESNSDTQGEAPTVEREVVEPDVIRRDENLLYVLNQYRGLTLVDLDTQSVLAQVPTYGYPRDLYLVGDRAYVLVAYAADYTVNGNTIQYDIKSRLYVVDVSTPDAASVIGSFDLEGDLVDSRLVGDVLYAVSAEYDWTWAEGVVFKAQTSGSWVSSVNIADPDNIFEADEVSFDSIGSVIHATSSAIFVAASNWMNDTTRITYVDISDPAGAIVVRDSVNVAGQVADKYKMDAWNSVLRVVSSAWADERKVYVSTVDLANPDALALLAETEFERARGDSLFATRFDGARAYIVTYFVVDPLFLVDLSDPQNPEVTGELEVPGWSTYIEPMGDRLLALGVDDTEGRRVSMSLFNVADPANPTLVDRVSFGQGWSWSSAYDDVEALTVLDDLIIVPFSGWEDDFGGYERLQFISFTPDDLAKRGKVDVHGSVLRSFEYDGEYYGVTSEQLARIDATDLDAPQVAGTVALAENVSDFVELSPTLGVEIITRYDDGTTLLRRKGLPLKTVSGEVEVSIGELVDAYPYGSSVVLVGVDWSESSGYKVALVDFSDPDNPEVDASLDVDVSPYYGYWWYLPYMPMVDMATSDAAIGLWYPIRQQGSSLLVGDRLVLRCSANAYDSVVGTETPQQGLAIVDLTQAAWTQTVGLGFEQVVSVNASGDKVYVASKVGIDPVTLFGDPLCAYYVTPFDPATGTGGSTANVPGAFVSYDSATQILVVRDDQWDAGYNYSSTLRTASWDGGTTVTAVDEESLPDGSANVLGRGGKVFIDTYDEGSLLYVATISANGNITMGAGLLVTDGWASLIDANATSAYLSVGGGALARYDCSGAPTLEELVEVMGTPARMRFGSSAAYAPLGYFGIVALGL